MPTIKEQLERQGTQWVVKRDSLLQQYTVDMLRNSWGSGNQFFPGPQPVSIERKHFRHLKKNRYVVCEKSDGVRHVMMAFMFHDSRMCVLVNRVFQVTLTPLSLPKNAYEGTILDGELVNDKVFLVYDAVEVSGISVRSKNLIERLLAAEPVITGTLKLATNPIVLRMKTFFGVKDLEKLQNEHVPALDYKTDGLVFTPIDEPIKTGTHETLFKWKPRDQNTVDFLIKRSRDKWSLHVSERGTLVFESELPDDKVPEWVTDGCIAECQYMVRAK